MLSGLGLAFTGIATIIITVVSIIKNFYDTMFTRLGYLTMTLLFGVVIFLSGIMYIAMGCTKGVNGKLWLILSGIVELVLGLFLTFSPTLSALTLPIVLGFWLLFKGFSLIGIGTSLSGIKGSGWGWTIFSAVILIICGIVILLQPLIFGVEAVIWWTGATFIIGGFTLMSYGFKLKDNKEE